MAPRRRWKTLVPTATLTAVSFTMSGQSAYALFPPFWPTSPPPSVVSPPPVSPPLVVVPPVSPPPFVSPPPPAHTISPPVSPPPPVVHHCSCEGPQTVPEPSTLVAGLAGLASAAGWLARHRKAANRANG